MSQYTFTVEQINVSDDELLVEVSASGPFRPEVKDPKFAVIFDNGHQKRQIPILVEAYNQLADGSCYIYARFTYDLKYIFYGEDGGNKITMWFSMIYGEEELVHKPFEISFEETIKKRRTKTSTRKQQREQVMDYRVEYPEAQNEVYLISEMVPFRSNAFVDGLRTFFTNLWHFIELLISIPMIPIFLVDGVLSATHCVLRKKTITGKGLVYVIKYAKWRVDSFCGMRVGVLGMKLGCMEFANWIGRHSSIKKSRVTFISNRRNDLSGNFEFVYEELKKHPDLDYKFLLTNKETQNMSFSQFIRIGYHFGCSDIILVDDFVEVLYMMKRRKGTTFFQLWHACGAFKTFGYTRLGKEGGQKIDSLNHRNYDYSTVSSKEIAKFYAEGFGISHEKVVATGIPRTDVFFDEEYKEKVVAAFYEKYPQLRERKIILFAPTFRGNGKNSGYYPVDQFDANKLYETLGEHYAIIIKHHPFVKKRNVIKEEYKDYIIDMSNNSELNDLLFVTDLLITDYSSVVFEASLLDIPMLFYAYDLDQYLATRGFYYEYETFVPGKIVKEYDKLCQAIEAEDFEQNKVESFKNRFFDGLDGQSAKRTADLILENMSK